MGRRNCYQLLLILVVATSCKSAKIVGYWERKEFHETQGSTQGDLSLFQDSTFLQYGAEYRDTATIPGWHTGAEMRGTWTKSNDGRLILYPSNSEYFLSLTIIQLTRNKLTVTLAGHPIKYQRGKLQLTAASMQ